MSQIILRDTLVNPIAPTEANQKILFLDSNGRLNAKFSDDTVEKYMVLGEEPPAVVKPQLVGAATSYVNNDIVVTIVNYFEYAVGATWVVEIEGGTYTRVDDKITWHLPDLSVAGDLKMTVRVGMWVYASSIFTTNVQLNPFTFSGLDVVTPATGAVDIKETPDVVANTATASDGTYLHISTDWYVSTDAAGSNIVASSLDDTVNKNTWKIPKGMTEDTVNYIWRRVKFSNGVLSFYGIGNKNSFTTSDTFNPWPEWDGTLDGAEIDISSGISNPSICTVDETNAILFYIDTVNSGRAIATPINRAVGSNIWTKGTDIIVSTSSCGDTSITAIDSTTVLCSFKDITDSNKSKIVCIHRSSPEVTDWSKENELPTSTDSTSYSNISRLSDTRAIIIYGSGASPYYGTLVEVQRVSTSTNIWTTGASKPLGAFRVDWTNVEGLGENSAMLVYKNAVSGFGKAVFAHRPDTSTAWTLEAEIPLSSTESSNGRTFLSKIDDTHVAVLSQKDGYPYRCEAVTLSRSSDASNVWGHGTPKTLSLSAYPSGLAMVLGNNVLCAYTTIGAIASYAVVATFGSEVTVDMPVSISSISTTEGNIVKTSDSDALLFYKDNTASSGKVRPIIAG